MSASQDYSVPIIDSILHPSDRNILIPIAPIPRAQSAIAAAVRLVHRLQCPVGTFTTLFVGGAGDAPAVALSHRAGAGSGTAW
jgi:hypothetical protein